MLLFIHHIHNIIVHPHKFPSPLIFNPKMQHAACCCSANNHGLNSTVSTSNISYKQIPCWASSYMVGDAWNYASYQHRSSPGVQAARDSSSVLQPLSDFLVTGLVKNHWMPSKPINSPPPTQISTLQICRRTVFMLVLLKSQGITPGT